MNLIRGSGWGWRRFPDRRGRDSLHLRWEFRAYPWTFQHAFPFRRLLSMHRSLHCLAFFTIFFALDESSRPPCRPPVASAFLFRFPHAISTYTHSLIYSLARRFVFIHRFFSPRLSSSLRRVLSCTITLSIHSIVHTHHITPHHRHCIDISHSRVLLSVLGSFPSPIDLPHIQLTDIYTDTPSSEVVVYTNLAKGLRVSAPE